MTNQHTSLSVGRSGEGEGASLQDRAFVPAASSPAVSPVPASIPSAVAESLENSLGVASITPGFGNDMAVWSSLASAALKAIALLRSSRCSYCDDTGDVHRADGEWLGLCDCSAAEFSRLQAIADAAHELIYGGGLINRGVDRGLVVVERADKSDPHYRLCAMLENYAPTQATNNTISEETGR